MPLNVNAVTGDPRVDLVLVTTAGQVLTLDRRGREELTRMLLAAARVSDGAVDRFDLVESSVIAGRQHARLCRTLAAWTAGEATAHDVDTALADLGESRAAARAARAEVVV